MLRRISPHNQRMHYIHKLHKQLVYNVFTTYNNNRINYLNELTAENAELIEKETNHDVTHTFMYNGVFYKATHEGIYGYSNKAIHPSMMDKVKFYVSQTDFDHKVQEGIIKNYIGKVLVIAQNGTDLYSLIPVQFHQAIPQLSSDLFNIGECLTDEQVEEFKTKNRKGLVEFQKLILEDLLTQ